MRSLIRLHKVVRQNLSSLIFSSSDEELLSIFFGTSKTILIDME